MNKIKVIDLLNMISKGEEIPKKVEYRGVIFENKNGDLLNDIDCSLFEHRSDGEEQLLPMLNDEAEIIEEKKIPEKLGVIKYAEDPATALIHNKVDEIIDYLHSKGE